VAAFVGGWLAYVYLWRDAGGRPLRYVDLTSRLHVQPTYDFVRRFSSNRTLADYVHRNAIGAARVPRIDWTRDEAVLISSGPRSSTAYTLRVLHATDENGRIVIVVREASPALRNPGRPQLTYPYRFLVFERTSKPIVVEWQGRA
jgi:hypothetical protein